MMKLLYQVSEGLRRRFPDGDDPFQMITRLMEECGELAAEVNHFEGSGVKRQKHGEPDKTGLAKEVMDVIRCALTLALYYGVEAELEAAVAHSYHRLKKEGFID